MAKITRTVGTGMTQRGVVRFDQKSPGDVELQIKAAISAFDRTSFIRISRHLNELASRILDETPAYRETKKKKFQPDSPQGYAVQIVELVV